MITRFLTRFYYRMLFQFPISHEHRVSILRSRGVRIGERCRILVGVEAFGSEPYLIRIGDHCEVTSGVRFITHDGATWVFRDFPDWSSKINRYGRIDIQSNSFIGINSIILPNVTVGPNAIIGAGSIVTKDVPPNSVVVGNPARVISDIETYRQRCIAQAVPGLEHQSKNIRDKLVEHFWKS